MANNDFVSEEKACSCIGGKGVHVVLFPAASSRVVGIKDPLQYRLLAIKGANSVT